MRAHTQIPLLMALLLAACSPKPEPVAAAPAVVAEPAEIKMTVEPMSDAEESRILAAAKGQVTDDGATVLEVLQHVEKLRRKEFKLAGFEMFHSGDGKPSVGVCYWIGSKRLPDDKFCDIGYDVSADHKTLTPSVGAATAEEQRELTVSKLKRGRDAFLRNIDEVYEQNCVEPGIKKKSC